MVKKIGLGRQFGSNKHHFSFFPAHALLVSVGNELRNVFPCELENGYVEPKDFLESLLKREPWALGGVGRRKHSAGEIAEFAEIGITCFPLPRYLLDTV